MAVPEMLPVLLNVEQVAEYLGLHKVTVLRFAREGKLPGFKVGREWRFRAADVEAWVEARRRSQVEFAARLNALSDRIRQEMEAEGYGAEDVERLAEEARGEKEGGREAFFALVDEIRGRNRGVDPEVIERDVAEAVREARRKAKGRENTTGEGSR